jgi:hypothetical protein
MVQYRNGPGEMGPGIPLDKPRTTTPHGVKHQAANYSQPTTVAAHMRPTTPTGTGLSPNVLATMDAKIPPAFAQRIRDNIAKK